MLSATPHHPPGGRGPPPKNRGGAESAPPRGSCLCRAESRQSCRYGLMGPGSGLSSTGELPSSGDPEKRVTCSWKSPPEKELE